MQLLQRLVCSLLAMLRVGMLVLLAPLALAEEADFPQPASLTPAVNFWIKVYTEADTESGFLHDTENLKIIYEKLPRDLKLIDERRKQIAQDLVVLGGGVRSNLSQNQQHLLELWGKDTSSERFAQAADNIRWQLGQRDRYLEGLGRSGAYVPHIRAVARTLGLPEELASLPHVESSYHPGALSSVAATGMFQFMRETARRFMRVDALVDERLDPYKSAFGAMKFLKENYDELGTWPLALTAYNHGKGGMIKAVQTTGTTDIGRIVEQYKGARFGFASRNFYAQFLAARQVENDAARFFGSVDKQSAPQFAEFEMKGFVDARTLAKNLGVSMEVLQQDNPALLKSVWSGNKRIPKGYIVKIDRSHFIGDADTRLTSLTPDDLHAAQTVDESHTVQKGETLSSIARLYRTSVAELSAINQLGARNTIKIGQKLILPQNNGAVPTVVVNQSEPASASSGRYTVLRGDTLSKIAERFRISAKSLLALNKLKDANALQPGQELIVQAEPAPASGKSLSISVKRADAASIPAVIGSSAASSSPSAPSAPAATSASEASVPAAPIPEQAAAVASMVHSMNEADYAVSADNSVEVLPEETLSHFADWLRVSSSDLLTLNGLKSDRNVRVGQRLTLDFSKVDQDKFASRRRLYHSALQAKFFNGWRISDTANYQLKASESLGQVVRQGDVPLWLFRQYNPGLDISRVQAGQTVVMPRVERVIGP